MRVAAVVILPVAALAAVSSAMSAATARPTVREMKVETRAAVQASRATVVAMRVVGPNVRYAVRISVSDPAAYLKYRFHRVVAVVVRLTNRLWLFRSRTVAVVDASGRVTLSVTAVRRGNTVGTRYYVRPDLEDCARNIGGFDMEIDPDNVAPPCPA